MKEAIWVLTRLAEGLSEHVFTCSACNRVVSEPNCYFTDKGNFNMSAVTRDLMKEYPYCHCGAKMKKDPQLQAKLSQYYRIESAWRKYAKTYQGTPVKRKRHWKIDEIISDTVPF